MRKAQKEILLQFIQTLHEAQDQLRYMINRNDNTQVMELLSHCQQGVIKLGNLIENLEGEGFVTIGYLEEYCEIAFQMYEKIRQNKNDKGGKVYKILYKQLVKIENSIKYDIEQQIEVVFLPYKASMWDSMESVWKAADEDDKCSAYVVPIPYYDKNPDGSIKQEYWEGQLYPDYVPITRYDAYDFVNRHPDMIIIHNPYDGINCVTSVPSIFYSQNLKKYTDCLVYIPYFVLAEIPPEDKEGIERIKHFCTLPGVLNSDKVIVQSDNFKKIYVNEIAKLMGNNTRTYWEKKIFGLGSPKIDKIVNTKKESLEIPEEWKKIIIKPDGSWKKVVIYNTSVGALLQYNEKMLEKMQRVFKTFKSSQASVALLWRPHPLIKATIESMKPQLKNEYQNIVEQYKNENWGIYDDSPNLERAVVLSDAYYGDRSSIVELCQVHKKPILIQEIE